MAANYIPDSENCVQMPHKALQLKTLDWDPEAMHIYKALTSDLVHVKKKTIKVNKIPDSQPNTLGLKRMISGAK